MQCIAKLNQDYSLFVLQAKSLPVNSLYKSSAHLAPATRNYIVCRSPSADSCYSKTP